MSATDNTQIYKVIIGCLIIIGIVAFLYSILKPSSSSIPPLPTLPDVNGDFKGL